MVIVYLIVLTIVGFFYIIYWVGCLVAFMLYIAIQAAVNGYRQYIDVRQWNQDNR